jgi:hypothetical protein
MYIVRRYILILGFRDFCKEVLIVRHMQKARTFSPHFLVLFFFGGEGRELDSGNGYAE